MSCHEKPIFIINPNKNQLRGWSLTFLGLFIYFIIDEVIYPIISPNENVSFTILIISSISFGLFAVIILLLFLNTAKPIVVYSDHIELNRQSLFKESTKNQKIFFSDILHFSRYYYRRWNNPVLSIYSRIHRKTNIDRYLYFGIFIVTKNAFFLIQNKKKPEEMFEKLMEKHFPSLWGSKYHLFTYLNSISNIDWDKIGLILDSYSSNTLVNEDIKKTLKYVINNIFLIESSTNKQIIPPHIRVKIMWGVSVKTVYCDMFLWEGNSIELFKDYSRSFNISKFRKRTSKCNNYVPAELLLKSSTTVGSPLASSTPSPVPTPPLPATHRTEAVANGSQANLETRQPDDKAITRNTDTDAWDSGNRLTTTNPDTTNKER